MARGKHLFPFRTEQLSLAAPMVLGSQGPGRVGRRRFFFFTSRPEGGSSSLTAPGPLPRDRGDGAPLRARAASWAARVLVELAMPPVPRPDRLARPPRPGAGGW